MQHNVHVPQSRPGAGWFTIRAGSIMPDLFEERGTMRRAAAAGKPVWNDSRRDIRLSALILRSSHQAAPRRML
ncbi:hypothetical protein BOSE21B_30481 [Bosea sp. 21B]|nr:hypothetical protein BOSE21B_30481 [Bosea sp. 21B]VXC04636.1 hypothetical protein BOSE127_170071 [Bosea sp. 127]